VVPASRVRATEEPDVVSDTHMFCREDLAQSRLEITSVLVSGAAQDKMTVIEATSLTLAARFAAAAGTPAVVNTSEAAMGLSPK
jgi:hypothetical protein